MEKIDVLKNIEEIEDADHDGFVTSLTRILHETSAVLGLLQVEVYSNWARKKIRNSEGEMLAFIEGYLNCNSYHLDDFLNRRGWIS